MEREQFHTLNTREPPTHGRARSGFLERIGKGLRCFGETRPLPTRGQARDEYAHDHAQAQCHHPFRLCDQDGGSEEQGVCEETEPLFDATPLFGGRRGLA